MKTIIKEIKPKGLVLDLVKDDVIEKKVIPYTAFFAEIFDIRKPDPEDIENFYNSLLDNETELTVMVGRYMDVYPDTIEIDPEAKPVKNEV